MVPPAAEFLTPADLPITPSVEAWHAMSVEARAKFINDVNSILSSPLEAKAADAAAKAADAKAKAADAKAKAADAAAKAADAEAKAADAEAKAERAIASLRESVLAVADARGVVYSEADRERIHTCDDPAILQRWLVRIAVAHSMTEVLAAT